MNVMTNQEIFDHVWTFLNKQRRQSKKELCVYRSNEGLSCAIGCLLDDETAHRFDDLGDQIGGSSIKDIYVHAADLIPKFLGNDIQFLSDLQKVHDMPVSYRYWLKEWRSGMMELANNYNLKPPVLEPERV